MGFFDRFRSRADEAPLPGLAALLEARGLPAAVPGLAALFPAFDAHRKVEEREAWADAVAEVHRQGLPLPEPWIDAQDHLLPELVPTWQAEREGRWSRGFIDGLSQRIRVGEVVMPAAWLRLWDQSADDVLDLALDHLRRRSEGAFVRLPSGIYRGPWRDGADAARLLLPELWHGLFKDQHPFIAIPTAETLLAAPQILLPKLMDEVGRVHPGHGPGRGGRAPTGRAGTHRRQAGDRPAPGSRIPCPRPRGNSSTWTSWRPCGPRRRIWIPPWAARPRWSW